MHDPINRRTGDLETTSNRYKIGHHAEYPIYVTLQPASGVQPLITNQLQQHQIAIDSFKQKNKDIQQVRDYVNKIRIAVLESI